MTACFTQVLSTAIFLNTDISQGSVATQLRCGGIFNYDFVANLSLSLTVKGFWKLVKIWQSYHHEFGGPLFLEHSVYIHIYIYTHSESIKRQASIILPITLPNVDWFSKLFHGQIHFCNISSLTIPPHLNCVTTLLCEISVFFSVQKIAMLKIWVYKASCHAKLSHSKQLLKILYSHFSVI